MIDKETTDKIIKASNIIEVNSNDNLTKYLSLDKDGNVGLGINNPSYNLDVIGDINFTGQLLVNGNPYTGSGFQWNVVNINQLYYNNGNVGIGTDDPNASLHVMGSKSPNILNEGIKFGEDSNNYSIDICSLQGTESKIDFKKTNISQQDRDALQVMELSDDVKWEKIHSKFKELVKKYHPDKNQGNKKFEDKLKKITLAYSQLKKTLGKK